MFVSDNILQFGKRKTGVQQLCVILGGVPYYIQNIAATADKMKSQGFCHFNNTFIFIVKSFKITYKFQKIIKNSDLRLIFFVFKGVEIFTVGVGSAFKTNSLLSDVASIPVPGHTLYTDYENLLLTSNVLHDKVKKGFDFFGFTLVEN